VKGAGTGNPPPPPAPGLNGVGWRLRTMKGNDCTARQPQNCHLQSFGIPLSSKIPKDFRGPFLVADIFFSQLETLRNSNCY
jgi:hypothetical protein